MCGIVGYIGDKERGRHHRRGAEAPRVSRLRLGGRGGHRLRRTAGPARRPDGSRSSKALLRERPGERHDRHRPHALGDPRPPHRRERASAHRRVGRPRRRAQRDHRELPADQGAAPGRGPPLPLGDRHRGHRAPDRAAPAGHAAARGGRAARAPRAARLVRHRRAVQARPRPAGRRQARGGQRGGRARARARRSSPPTSPPSSPTRATSSSSRTRTWRWSPRHGVEVTQLDGGPVAARADRASSGIRSWPRRAATGTSC